MNISKKTRMMLTAAVVLSFSSVSAQGEIGTGSIGQMTQSDMINVNNGKTMSSALRTGIEPIGEAPTAISKADASMYLSTADEEAITANEGKTITEIGFDGAPKDVKARLYALIQSKVGSSVKMETIKSDVTALGGTGIFSRISPTFNSVPEGVKLKYQLTANPVVYKLDIQGNTVFRTQFLAELLNIQAGSVLDLNYVKERLKEIETLYLKQGYILVSFPDVHMTEDGTLHITVEEGTIEDIKLVGNEKTKDHVVLRELRFRKGHPFNKFLASRSMERLYNLGFFEDVNMKLLPGEGSSHSVIVEIDMIEQKTGIVTVGAGYSNSDGIVGMVEVGDSNFRGTGDKVNVHWEFGGSGRGKNYQFSYTRPWINDKGDSLGFSLYNRIYQYDDFDATGNTVAEYQKRKKGWNLTWGRVSDEYRTNYLNFESTKEALNSEPQAGPGAVPDKWEDWKKKIKENIGKTNSMTFTHVYDSRDNYFNATKGKRLSYALQWGGHGLGGNFDFYKFTAEGRFYKQLGNGHVLALRLMGGYISGHISYSDLFSLGGANNLRGYEDDQFKGDKMYAATLEYRLPIAKKVQGVLFTDVGSTWGIDRGQIPWYKDDRSIHFSAGVGLRLQTPIGPVRLDYGYGKKGKFHFSFGTQF
ncbi:outer membrane protein, OMP85 family [Veillonellaceae bacterium DNF00626]|nr:outer membrane protein, OMP85 family [Veillonellaceae bacterium DNF00626]